jgi:hypothetical protein
MVLVASLLFDCLNSSPLDDDFPPIICILMVAGLMGTGLSQFQSSDETVLGNQVLRHPFLTETLLNNGSGKMVVAQWSK